MQYDRPIRLTPALVLCLLTACSATTDTTRFYTLKPITNQFLTNKSGSSTVSIESIVIPRLLNRPQIVSRIGQNEIKRAEYHQWGGSIEEEIKQLLTTELEQELSEAGYYVFPRESRSRPDYNLYLDINRLDGQLGEEAVFEMTWLLESDQDQQLSARGSLRHSTQLKSHNYSDYVAALHALLVRGTQALGEELKTQLHSK